MIPRSDGELDFGTGELGPEIEYDGHTYQWEIWKGVLLNEGTAYIGLREDGEPIIEFRLRAHAPPGQDNGVAENRSWVEVKGNVINGYQYEIRETIRSTWEALRYVTHQTNLVLIDRKQPVAPPLTEGELKGYTPVEAVIAMLDRTTQSKASGLFMRLPDRPKGLLD